MKVIYYKNYTTKMRSFLIKKNWGAVCSHVTLYTDKLKINNEQVNLLRNLVKRICITNRAVSEINMLCLRCIRMHLSLFVDQLKFAAQIVLHVSATGRPRYVMAPGLNYAK